MLKQVHQKQQQNHQQKGCLTNRIPKLYPFRIRTRGVVVSVWVFRKRQQKIWFYYMCVGDVEGWFRFVNSECGYAEGF